MRSRPVIPMVLMALLPGTVLGQDSAAVTVTTVAQYEAGLASLALDHTTALVGITADWCAHCQAIKAQVLPDSAVQEMLVGIPLISVDVTAADDDTADILTHLEAWGPPTFFIIDLAAGAEQPQTRSLGMFTVEDLSHRLAPFAVPDI